MRVGGGLRAAVPGTTSGSPAFPGDEFQQHLGVGGMQYHRGPIMILHPSPHVGALSGYLGILWPGMGKYRY